MVKIVPRGNSATADAYLTPKIQTYLAGFFAGFDEGIRTRVKVEFMQSDGGLAPVDSFSGFRAILSGPAGGVVGYAMTSYDAKQPQPVIGFDMGGTSTDVSRYAGRYEHVFETTTAGVTIQAPQLDILTVAAGGGSRLFYRNGMFVTGPESAGADPGPICYRKNGHLAITDANLLLGRLLPSYFPKIFGKSENEPLDIDASRLAFEALATQINKERGDKAILSVDEVAYGFIKVANEAMARPIRALTQGKGFDTASHVLSCFGGAGGQHACAIARSLGIRKILIHRYSSILSAFGLALADVVNEEQEPCALSFTSENFAILHTRAAVLKQTASQTLIAQGFPNSHINCELFLNLRYQGTDTALMIPQPANDSWDFTSPFVAQYQQEFGFTLQGRSLIVDDIRVRATGRSDAALGATASVWDELKTIDRKVPVAREVVDVYFEGGRRPTGVYLNRELQIGDVVVGPALLLDNTATVVVEPGCEAVITSDSVVVDVGGVGTRKVGVDVDPIQLAIFGHRFMSIAEQMGRTLQKTSISTNIKERLDFSCALFGPDAGLVANAPHIPVHLGSMQEAVRWQAEYLGGNIKDGDVLVTNHPSAGGSHLPDITVITPVFNQGKIVFFVASRGHHADIGGMQPGSMPPNSCELFQEGAAIKSFKLVENGVFDEAGITKILLEDPAQYEGCTGTRCLRDNISDLKAQVAANQRGINLVTSLIEEYSLDVVQAYMHHIRANAEQAVRELLIRMRKQYGPTLNAVDYMDDGTPIKLAITINTDGTATFDFTGTGQEVYGNTNAPRSVTYSAIIYCLRCMVALDMPLNQGALAPIKIIIPKGSLLYPSDDAAVVGGNVMTSQRLCDVVFRAFNAVAASQGCCNNFTFGIGASEDGEGFGYYETIAGGSGAGPSWDGRSGVHTHMTNTRITDPEILERRYPVLLRQFGLRSGGEGVIRELEFLETIDVSILSERRVFQPYGLEGGQPGQTGRNILVRADGREVSFGGKNATVVKKGDVIRIETPGGGGWGLPSTNK
ncbi:hypothetical protein HK096_006595 [Nowakowskiella sp. JEL0078]|nr:hypothetical protein HK096_006595 [Nowakowskiella sp. JEL0078]